MIGLLHSYLESKSLGIATIWGTEPLGPGPSYPYIESTTQPALCCMSPGPERSEGGMEGVRGLREGRLGPNRKIEATNWGESKLPVLTHCTSSSSQEAFI